MRQPLFVCKELSGPPFGTPLRSTSHEPLTTSHYPHSLRQGDDGGYGGYADGDVGLTVGFIDFFLRF